MEPMGAPASQLILMKTLVYNHFPFFFFLDFKSLTWFLKTLVKSK